ncbi:uncharacterized protein MELLADRAFT_73362 [Melampsora larici-populina 98AG31]|uniref:Heme haloperoxidase family profile domain-containing protein n=1 Tax=Melampsora larici-populina (strain 98AG31 / pathotype 3-4-7) TaxID=747676 RepID=F4S712_MELLP|nr:uncharacterized protein MELLADRAFT_73362 [Melampsora larici-populina 98AG31]EGF99554.1 hypothetical protein MELLADRAFT_73362 [Melampsora larici-populina 98AG31]
MLSSVILLITLLQQTCAFPRMLAERSGTLNVTSEQQELQSRGLLDLVHLIPTVLNLKPVLPIGRKRIPDADHPFMPPGPNDIRGGCPGLNIMANYGYISRNGITDAGEVMYGMQEMLGFSFDIAAIILVLGIKSSFDLTTLKTSIGRTDSRTDGPLSGLFGTASGFFSKASHNKFEVDGSLTRVDGYFANGNTDHFDSNHWKQYRQLAIDHFGGVMDFKFEGAARFMQYKECREKNPECTWALGEQLPLYIAQAFVSDTLTSADENGNLLPPDVKSVETFFGIVENPDGTFSRGVGKLPPGPDGYWYRRSVPLTFVEQTLSLTQTLLPYPVVFGRNNGNLGHWDADLTDLRNIEQANVACYILQQTRDPKDSKHANNPVLNKALGVLLSNTLQPIFEQLGCN